MECDPENGVGSEIPEHRTFGDCPFRAGRDVSRRQERERQDRVPGGPPPGQPVRRAGPGVRRAARLPAPPARARPGPDRRHVPDLGHLRAGRRRPGGGGPADRARRARRQGADRRAGLLGPAAAAGRRRRGRRRAGRRARLAAAPPAVLRRLQRAPGPGLDPAAPGDRRGRPPTGGADRPGPAAAGRGGRRRVRRVRVRGPQGRPGERRHHGERGGLPLLEPEPGADRRAGPGLPRGRPERPGRPALPRRPHPQPAPPGDDQLRRALGRVRLVLLVRGRLLGAARRRRAHPAAGRARPGAARRRPGRPAPLPGRAARRRPPGRLHHPLAVHGRRHPAPPGPHRRGRGGGGDTGPRRARGRPAATPSCPWPGAGHVPAGGPRRPARAPCSSAASPTSSTSR